MGKGETLKRVGKGIAGFGVAIATSAVCHIADDVGENIGERITEGMKSKRKKIKKK